MPKIINCNPQSLYNKSSEFITLIEQKEIDVAFVSETWERKVFKLEDLLKNLANFSIISNYNQRNEKGGRPALLVNNDKFFVQNLTQDVVKIPWGCEVVWALITPKQSGSSKVKKIVCGAVYCKPGSKTKTLLLDHITDTKMEYIG